MSSKHFGSVLILGRSGWGKTYSVQQVLRKHTITDADSIVQLIPDDYKSWNRWQEETQTMTIGGSVFAMLYKKIDTIVIEDIHDSFLWNTSVRMKFLKQVQMIAKHSNIILTLDTFGVKVPKIWTNPKSWNEIIHLESPSVHSRFQYCKTHPILSTLNDSQISFLVETMQDTSFRSLDRVGRFFESSDTTKTGGVITFSVLRQAASSVGTVYLPPGLFKNAKEWVQNPNLPRSTLETMYSEDPFHFPYIIWNNLPRFCYHNGTPNMLDCYMKLLDSMLQIDNPSHSFRTNEFCLMYHWFHKGWKIRESIVFQIPNIRNKISYSKVRDKLLQTVVETTHIPPMFVLERVQQDKELRKKIPETILRKIK